MTRNGDILQNFSGLSSMVPGNFIYISDVQNRIEIFNIYQGNVYSLIKSNRLNVFLDCILYHKESTMEVFFRN